MPNSSNQVSISLRVVGKLLLLAASILDGVLELYGQVHLAVTMAHKLWNGEFDGDTDSEESEV